MVISAKDGIVTQRFRRFQMENFYLVDCDDGDQLIIETNDPEALFPEIISFTRVYPPINWTDLLEDDSIESCLINADTDFSGDDQDCDPDHPVMIEQHLRAYHNDNDLPF
jgi:hypothetical protein